MGALLGLPLRELNLKTQAGMESKIDLTKFAETSRQAQEHEACFGTQINDKNVAVICSSGTLRISIPKWPSHARSIEERMPSDNGIRLWIAWLTPSVQRIGINPEDALVPSLSELNARRSW